MTKDDLVRNVATKTGVELNTVKRVVEASMEATMEFLADDEALFLRGFGTFLPKHRKAKKARNISKNTSIEVPAHKTPFFKPSPNFKGKLAK